MKRINEDFAQFFENPTREGLKDILKLHFGEQDNLDFKSEWPVFSKIAKHIIAIANSGGGCIVLGVTELSDKTYEPTGLNKIEDKADIKNKVNRYIPDEISYQVLDFHFPTSDYVKIQGRKFQVIFIDYNPEYIPFLSKIDGDGIRKNNIYVRRGTESEEANYEEIQKLINIKIETGYSTTSEVILEEHLAQLKILYSNIKKYHNHSIGQIMSTMMGNILDQKVPNTKFPSEDFDDFIVKMIDLKKKRIENILLK
jgi:predicted HTH transcriptional regulator